MRPWIDSEVRLTIEHTQQQREALPGPICCSEQNRMYVNVFLLAAQRGSLYVNVHTRACQGRHMQSSCGSHYGHHCGRAGRFEDFKQC